jgi:3-dehydroquinate synthase
VKKINVNLKERAYDIVIMSGLLDDLSAKLESFVSKRKVLVISDSNVSKIYADKVMAALKGVCSESDIAIFPAGEPSKTLKTVETLYEKGTSYGLDRSSVVIALGGGVVGDIAGFFAATYMRGIDFIQIPTSLLAMVDSSVGGKTGVDLPAGKNLVGAFWQPKVVLIDPDTLNTLPKREVKCGLAEVVKYGIIMDNEFFRYLEDHTKELNELDSECFTSVIARCCTLKAQVVVNDEREESGIRAILNYGHTFAHAIEVIRGFENINHGEAVAIGMCMAASLSVADMRLDDAAELRQENLLRALHLPCSIDGVKSSDIYAAMHKDKKTVNGKLRFVLPETIGEVTLVSDELDRKMIMQAIRNCCD